MRGLEILNNSSGSSAIADEIVRSSYFDRVVMALEILCSSGLLLFAYQDLDDPIAEQVQLAALGNLGGVICLIVMVYHKIIQEKKLKIVILS